jgi:hypothetical protein
MVGGLLLFDAGRGRAGIEGATRDKSSSSEARGERDAGRSPFTLLLGAGRDETTSARDESVDELAMVRD